MGFEFKCTTCGEIHRGIPTFSADKPLSYVDLPEKERDERCDCGEDYCVIDEKWFFVRGCIEIHVHNEEDPFIWGVWVSLSIVNYHKWIESFDMEKRSHISPFFGWLNAWLKPYPNTINLKTRVYLRDKGTRPYIEIESTDHPLAVEQREGISKDRVAEIYSIMIHGK